MDHSFLANVSSVLNVRHRRKGAEQSQRQSEMIEHGWIDGENNGANFLPAAMILLPKSVFSAQFDALCVHTIAVTESLRITSLYFSTKQGEYFGTRELILNHQKHTCNAREMQKLNLKTLLTQ